MRNKNILLYNIEKQTYAHKFLTFSKQQTSCWGWSMLGNLSERTDPVSHYIRFFVTHGFVYILPINYNFSHTPAVYSSQQSLGFARLQTYSVMYIMSICCTFLLVVPSSPSLLKISNQFLVFSFVFLVVYICISSLCSFLFFFDDSVFV